MKKSHKLLVEIGYLLYIIIIFFLSYKVGKIENLLLLFLLSLIISIFYHRIALQKWKYVLNNVYSFFIIVYYIYANMSPFLFIIDDFSPRVYNLGINYYSMLNTILLYFRIFLVFIFIMTLLGFPKLDYSFIKLKKIKFQFKKRFLADIIASICVAYFCYLFFRNGFSIFSSYMGDIRASIASGVNYRYIYIFISMYTYTNIINMYDKKKINLYDLYRIILLLLFWSLSIFIDRRAIVFTIVMIFITILSKMFKIKLKNIIVFGLIILVFLLSAFFREGKKMSDSKLNDVLYYSTGEFVLTNYVSIYYYNQVNYGYNLLNGSTYTYYTISYLFPSIIWKDKPENLGIKFYKEANVNVAFGFNPVAEGLINFGKASLYITPIIFALYVICAHSFGKKNYFIYILMYGYTIDFMRGMFAICCFELLFFIIIFKLFYDLGENENENITNNSNA